MLFDEKQFNEIVEKYQAELYKYIFKATFNNYYLSDDILNDVFFTLYDKWESLKNFDNIRAWLFRTSDNIIKRSRRETSKNEKRYSEYDEYLKSDDTKVYNEFNKDKYEYYILEINKELDAEQIIIFQYHFIDKIKIVEISKILNIPHSTVRHKIMKIEKIAQKIITDILDNEIT